MKKETKTFTCQECGERLLSAGTYHTRFDCGQYHLKRAYEILRGYEPQKEQEKKEGES